MNPLVFPIDFFSYRFFNDNHYGVVESLHCFLLKEAKSFFLIFWKVR